MRATAEVRETAQAGHARPIDLECAEGTEGKVQGVMREEADLHGESRGVLVGAIHP